MNVKFQISFLLFSLLLTYGHSVVPNCAYETQGNCLSCYYGFRLRQGKCNQCLSGFVKISQICVEQNTIQQQILDEQDQIVANSQNSIQTEGQTSYNQPGAKQQKQSSKQLVLTPQNPIIQSNPQFSTNKESGNSPTVSFDINNTGVMYLLSLFGLTNMIPPNCQSFTPQFKCLKCQANYYLDTALNKCVLKKQTTPVLQKPSIYGEQSINYPSNSDPYCQTASTIQSSVCQRCYHRYYYNSTLSKCTEVDPYCKTWNDQGHCLTCYQGYVLSSIKCNVKIQNTTNPNTTSKSNTNSTNGGAVSIQTDANCQLIALNGQCAQCFNRFYYDLTQRKCKAVGEGCQTWVSNGQCKSCRTNYTLGVNILGKVTCIKNQSPSNQDIPFGQQVPTNSNNVTGFDSNCRVFNSISNRCSQCYYSFYYQPNQRKCIPVNALCRTWNNQGQCLTCYQGYQLDSNKCTIQSAYQRNTIVGTNDLPEGAQDPMCHTYSNKICVKCATRTYMDSTTNRCTQIDSNCRLWDTDGVCNRCYDGYIVSTSNPKKCNLINPQVSSVQLKSSLNSDPNCRASDQLGVCTQCIFRYVLIQNTKTCKKVNDQCRTWNNTNALCTGCYGGYALINGECKVAW